MKNIFKRATALMLSLLMVFSVCSTALIVYAETGSGTGSSKPQSETIKYVSIGDSMTNGYGFTGYNQDMHTINRDEVHLTEDVYNFFDGTNVYGKGSYALQFEEFLKGIYGADRESVSACADVLSAGT